MNLTTGSASLPSKHPFHRQISQGDGRNIAYHWRIPSELITFQPSLEAHFENNCDIYIPESVCCHSHKVRNSLESGRDLLWVRATWSNLHSGQQFERWHPAALIESYFNNIYEITMRLLCRHFQQNFGRTCAIRAGFSDQTDIGRPRIQRYVSQRQMLL